MYVREGDGERAVGQYPDGTAEEALAYFERKYTDLAGQVTLLEQRARRGAPARRRRQGGREPPHGGRRARTPSATSRRCSPALDALGGTVEELTEQQSAEAKAAVERADRRSHRDRRARPRPSRRRIRHARSGSRPPPSSTRCSPAGRRTSTTVLACPRTRPTNSGSGSAQHARRSSTTARPSSPSSTTSTATSAPARTHSSSRRRRLIPLGADGVPEYRRLLDQWKLAGRAGKKNDDALWARFKAAGDAIYSAKAEVDARDNEEYQANLELKLALLDEAEPLLGETDRETARTTAALDPASAGTRSAGCRATRYVRSRIACARSRPPSAGSTRSTGSATTPRRRRAPRGSPASSTPRSRSSSTNSTTPRPAATCARSRTAQEALDARKIWLDALG